MDCLLEEGAFPCVLKHVGVRSWWWVSFSTTSGFCCFPLKQDHLLSLELIDWLGWLPSKLSPSVSCHHPTQGPHVGIFCGFWASELRPSGSHITPHPTVTLLLGPAVLNDRVALRLPSYATAISWASAAIRLTTLSGQDTEYMF